MKRRQSGRQVRRAPRGRHAADAVELGHARLGAGHLEERVGPVQLTLTRPAREQLVAEHAEAVQVDDRLVDAGDLLGVHDSAELQREAMAHFVPLALDPAGRLVDRRHQRALEADLGRLREPGAAHTQVHIGEQRRLEVRLDVAQELILEAEPHNLEVVVADEGLVAGRRQDDEEGVAEARDGDEVLVADEVAARIVEPPADGAVHLVHDLEALRLLERVDAVDRDVQDAQLAVVAH